MNPPRSLADTRTLFLVIPHWRTIAAGVSCDTPAVVLDNNRVIDATPGAANHGIKLGIRRREAQSLCPELEIIVDDEERNTTKFVSLAVVLESVTPRLEITTGGQCSFLTRGPCRYFGGDQARWNRGRQAERRGALDELAARYPVFHEVALEFFEFVHLCLPVLQD